MRPSEIVLKPRAARAGGLFAGPFDDNHGARVLREALDLFPGARVQVLDGAGPEKRREAMRRAAYLILPCAQCDAVPRVLVEAFASGLPVIASRVGVLAELVEPGRSGLLFEPESARDLARRMTWAEAFPEKMRQMGECAKADYRARFITHFSFPRLFGERRRAARP